MSRARSLLPSVVYAALALADSVAAGRRGTTARRLRYVLKPALMPALAIAFLDGTRDLQDPDVTVLRTGTAAAQALSWGGDVALLGQGERSFLTGVGSFAGAHVAYIAAFLSVRGESRAHHGAGLPVALVLWLTTAPLMSAVAGTVHAGTALFLLSDCVLAAQRFLLSEPRPVLDSVVMTTYTAGQGLIAAGAAGASRGGRPGP